MRGRICTMAMGILIGLLVTSIGWGQVMVAENFEGSLAAQWNDGVAPSAQLLQTGESGGGAYYNDQHWDAGRLKSMAQVVVEEGLVIEFDSKADFGGQYPWVIVGVAKTEEPSLDVNDFVCGVYITGGTDTAYVFCGPDGYQGAPITRGIWQHFRLEVVEGDYVELSVDGIRAARAEQPATGAYSGPVVVCTQYGWLDNVVTGTESDDGEFRDGFDESTLSGQWRTTGSPSGYISTKEGRPGGSFHSTAETAREASAHTQRCFQLSAGTTISFDAKVTDTPGAFVGVGILEDVPGLEGTPEMLMAFCLSGDLDTVGWLCEEQYSDAPDLDTAWHSYAIIVPEGGETVAFYMDGMLIDNGYNLYLRDYANVPIFVTAKDGYVDNIEIK